MGGGGQLVQLVVFPLKTAKGLKMLHLPRMWKPNNPKIVNVSLPEREEAPLC